MPPYDFHQRIRRHTYYAYAAAVTPVQLIRRYYGATIFFACRDDAAESLFILFYAAACCRCYIADAYAAAFAIAVSCYAMRSAPLALWFSRDMAARLCALRR